MHSHKHGKPYKVLILVLICMGGDGLLELCSDECCEVFLIVCIKEWPCGSNGDLGW